MSTENDGQFLAEVAAELKRARAKWTGIASPHEGYSVILEELDEFWEEVKRKQTEHDPAAMRAELIQIAAMAARTAVDCELASRARAVDSADAAFAAATRTAERMAGRRP